ncbi:MAG: hypothetical protein KKD77_21050 [Gammaproteobacteria bacterium]|nr:hypothetical protein [Gammaproteobacteria bacterium]
MTTLVFEAPGPDSPGYLRRSRQALEFQRSLSDNPTPETLDRMVEFLAQYVSEPADHDAKIEALWMASKAQFNDLLTAISAGEGENPTPAPTT